MVEFEKRQQFQCFLTFFQNITLDCSNTIKANCAILSGTFIGGGETGSMYVMSYQEVGTLIHIGPYIYMLTV